MESKICSKDKKILGTLMLIIFVINLLFITIDYAPLMQSDEYGYLGLAAYFAKLDWTDMLNTVFYYSFGYSLLLMPLFAIFKEALLVFKGTMIINSLLITFSVPFIYNFIKDLYPEISRKLLYPVIFLLSFNVVTTARVSSALTESLLIFLFWSTLTIFRSLIKNPSGKKILLLSFLLGYSYMVHQRAVVFTIAAFVTFSFMLFNKKLKLMDFIKYLLIISIFIITTATVKNYLITNIWTSDTLKNTNDYNSIFSSIVAFFTFNGFISFLKNCIGYLFYFGQSTYLLGYFGIYFIIKDFIFYIKTKDKPNFYFILFLLLSFIGTISLTSLFFISSIRIDTLMYGRYSEMVIFPIVCYGIIKLYCLPKTPYKLFAMSSVFLLIATFITNIFVNKIKYAQFVFIHVPAMDIFMDDANNLHVYIAAFVAIGVGFIIFIILKKTNVYFVASLVFSGVSAYLGYNTIYSSIKYDELYIRPNIQKLTEIRKSPDIKNVYFLNASNNMKPFVNLQFYLFDKPLNILNFDAMRISKKDISYFVKEDDYLITDYISEKILNNFTCERFTGTFFLLKPKKDINKDGFTINAANLAIYEEHIKNTYIESNGKESTILNNPEFVLEKGKYKVTFDMELIENKNTEDKKIASIYVAGFSPEILYSSYDLYSKDITDNKFSKTLDIDATSGNLSTSFIVNSYENSIIRINSVTIKSAE